MAISSIPTILSLQEFCEIMEISPWLFNQLDAQKIGAKTDYKAWMQFQHQTAATMSRENIALAISGAEEMLANELDYWPGPKAIVNEYHPYPLPFDATWRNIWATDRWTLKDVKDVLSVSLDDTFIGAYLAGELIGFVQLAYGDRIAVMSQILSLQKHWDKAVNNVLVAKAVEVCAARNVPYLMYGRMGNHPSLDSFKESNSFSKCTLTRYYVPLTGRGRTVAKLRLHRDAKDRLPQPFKGPLIPVFNWVSRTKVKLRRKPR